MTDVAGFRREQHPRAQRRGSFKWLPNGTTQEWEKGSGRAKRRGKGVALERRRAGWEVIAPVDADLVGKLHEGFLRGKGELCEAEEESLSGDGREVGGKGGGKGTTTKRRQAQGAKFGPSELSKNSAIGLREEGNCFSPASADLAGVRANDVDALLGPVAVQLGLKGTGESNADTIRELGVVKDTKPCINVKVDTLGANRAGLEELQRCWVNDGAVLVGLGGNGGGLRELADLSNRCLLLSTQNSISTNGGVAGEAASCR